MIVIDPPAVPRYGRMWSHLASDTSYDELHVFAADLGIPPRGFDRDHYDVPSEYYDAAVAAGAVPVTSRALVVMLVRAGLRRRKNARSHGGGLMRGRENKDATTDRWERHDWWEVTLESPDPARSSRFWSAVLDKPIYTESEEGGSIDFQEGVVGLSVQKAEVYEPPVWPPEPGKQGMQLHLEIEVTDLAAASSTPSSSERRRRNTSPRRRAGDARSGRPPVLPLHLSELRLDVGAGGGLPVLAGVGGVEQRRLGEQVAQDGRAAGGEQVVGDVGVLAADIGDVLGIALGCGGQDRQVGVGEDAAVRVVGLRSWCSVRRTSRATSSASGRPASAVSAQCAERSSAVDLRFFLEFITFSINHALSIELGLYFFTAIILK